MTRQLAIVFLVCAVAHLTMSSSDAGTIIGVDSISGGGTATVSPILTGDENNDNEATTSTPISNIVVASKLFNATEPIDIVFDVRASQGVTEYRLVEGVANLSGFGFLQYAFELGFGTGDDFVASVGDDGLDFDAPNLDPAPISSPLIFDTMAHSEDFLNFSAGLLPNAGTGTFMLSIDIPDFNADLMPASAATDQGYRFTLRQIPTIIPEPGTIGIAVLSALAWAIFTLRRRWG